MTFLLKGKEYKILQRQPHLLTTTEDPQTIALVDTGFNGTTETIPSHETFGGATRGKKVIWIGSKYLQKRGNCLDINYSRGVLRIAETCQPTQKAINFTDSSSCSGMMSLACPLGPIVAIPVRVTQGSKKIKSNGFVDTGSGFSVVLRSRMHKNEFKELEVEPCTSSWGTVDVHIDTQNLKFKPRPLTLSLGGSGEVATSVNKMMISCGKNDPVPSDTYNDKLGDIDLEPRVGVTVGNDALITHGRVQIDYANRIMYFGNSTLRQFVSFDNVNYKIIAAVAVGAVALSAAKSQKHKIMIVAATAVAIFYVST